MITKSQALAKLASNPSAAAQFDAASKRDHPGKSRDQVIDLTLQALNAKRDKTATLERLKRESADLKLKLSKLKAAVAIKAAGLKPVAVIKPTATAATAAAPANKLTGASYALLSQAATHRSSPPAEKAAARAELVAAHGVSITDSGIVSHSQRGGRALKLSKSNQ